MKIGFHTDAFNSAYFSFEKCLDWAQRNGVHYIECGLIDGVELGQRIGVLSPYLPLRRPGVAAAKDGRLRRAVLPSGRRLSPLGQDRRLRQEARSGEVAIQQGPLLE
jgi:hypothetical protein